MKTATLPLYIVIALVIAIFFTFGSAFAFWQEVTVPRDVNVITIGEGVELTIDPLKEGEVHHRLVPQGYVLLEHDVDVVNLSYRVGVTRELITTATLVVSVESILIDGEPTYAHLIDIDIMGQGALATFNLLNEDIDILVDVRLIEPIDAEEADRLGLDPSLVNVDDSVEAYHSIINQQVTFVLRFELRPRDDTPN